MQIGNQVEVYVCLCALVSDTTKLKGKRLGNLLALQNIKSSQWIIILVINEFLKIIVILTI